MKREDGKGDLIVAVTSEFIAVEHADGEIRLIPLRKDERGINVDTRHITKVKVYEDMIAVRAPDGVFVADI